MIWICEISGIKHNDNVVIVSLIFRMTEISIELNK